MSSEPPHRDYCQSLYRQLLMTPPKDPRLYMWQLNETQKCDDQHDLKVLRESYRLYLGPEAYNRAVNLESTRQEDLKIQQAQWHHHLETRTRIADGLNWPNWARYQWSRLFN